MATTHEQDLFPALMQLFSLVIFRSTTSHSRPLCMYKEGALYFVFCVFSLPFFLSEALYRGWYPVVTSLCCSNFVYFYVYNSLKAILAQPGKQSHPAKDLALAYIAGMYTMYIILRLQ